MPAAHRLSHQAIDGLVIIRTEQATPESLSLPAGMAVAVADSRLAGHYPTVGADEVQGSTEAADTCWSSAIGTSITWPAR